MTKIVLVIKFTAFNTPYKSVGYVKGYCQFLLSHSEFFSPLSYPVDYILFDLCDLAHKKVWGQEGLKEQKRHSAMAENFISLIFMDESDIKIFATPATNLTQCVKHCK